MRDAAALALEGGPGLSSAALALAAALCPEPRASRDGGPLEEGKFAGMLRRGSLEGPPRQAGQAGEWVWGRARQATW